MRQLRMVKFGRREWWAETDKEALVHASARFTQMEKALRLIVSAERGDGRYDTHDAAGMIALAKKGLHNLGEIEESNGTECQDCGDYALDGIQCARCERVCELMARER